jgi:hypothetical protein
MAEHAVLAHLQLADANMGSDREVEDIYALSGPLTEAIEEHGVGEFDGDEFGGGECVLFM